VKCTVLAGADGATKAVGLRETERGFGCRSCQTIIWSIHFDVKRVVYLVSWFTLFSFASFLLPTKQKLFIGMCFPWFMPPCIPCPCSSNLSFFWSVDLVCASGRLVCTPTPLHAPTHWKQFNEMVYSCLFLGTFQFVNQIIVVHHAWYDTNIHFKQGFSWFVPSKHYLASKWVKDTHLIF